jgi:hypothetical protein
MLVFLLVRVGYEAGRSVPGIGMSAPITTRQIWFYGLAAAALIIQVIVDLNSVLPDAIATPLEESGETWMFVLLLCAHVQFVRPRLPPTQHGWILSAMVAGGYAAVAVALHKSGGLLPPSLVTLHEPWFAMVPLTLYFQLPRPVRWPGVYSAVTLVGIAVFYDVGFVFDQSESLGLLVLAPIAFDIADPRILDPRARDRPIVLAFWCLSLAVLWLVLMTFVGEIRWDLTDPWEQFTDYTYRTNECIPAVLLVHLFFSNWMSRDTRPH